MAQLPTTAGPAQSPPVLVSLSSFGAGEVRRHGQAWFARLALAAGADGVEVRGELFDDANAELPALAEALRASAPHLVYSSPEGLWNEAGGLDAPALERAIRTAGQLGAARLKMSIGRFAPRASAGLRELGARVQGRGIELLIENDQTASAGTLHALQAFFDAAGAAGLTLGMTFDMGNWHWQGECPLQAAQALAPHVRYVHCKGVQRERARWVAVPLAQSGAAWRAVLRALPAELPCAIEYPLVGDDLLGVTRDELATVRRATGAEA